MCQAETEPLLGASSLHRNRTIPAWRKLFYGLGTFAETAAIMSVGTYFTPFLLDVAKLPASYVSAITFTSTILDALAYPIAGYAFTRASTRFGKFRPGIAAVVPFIALFYLAMWYVPSFELSEKIRAAYYGVTWSMFYILTATYSTGMASLVPALTNCPQERDLLVTYRITCYALGQILSLLVYAVVLVPPMHCSNTPSNTCTLDKQKLAYGLASWIITIVVLLFGCLPLVNPERHRLHPDRVSITSLLRSYWSVASYKPFVILNICIIFVANASKMFAGNYALYYKYVLNRETLFPFVMLGIRILTFLTVPIWNIVCAKIGRKSSLNACIFTGMVVFWSHLFVRSSLPVLITLAIGFAVLDAGKQYLAPAMVLDVLTMFGVEHGSGKEPMFFALNNAAIRVLSSITLSLSSLALQVVGFQSGTAEQQGLGVDLALRLVVGACPVVLLLVGFVALAKYPEKQMVKNPSC